jgi:hypothetical protein
VVGYASGTFTRVFGFPVPNILIATVLIGGAVNFILSCAAGLVSPLRDSARKSLRIKSLGILAAAAAAIAYPDIGHEIGESGRLMSMLYVLTPLLVFVPFLACYGSDGERRVNYNKLFAWRDMFGKSVAGALPFIYSAILAVAGGTAIGTLAGHRVISLQLPILAFYAFGFWTFAWATARLSSSFGHGVKPSRTLQFLTFAAALGIPLPALVALSLNYQGSTPWSPVWIFYPLSPFLMQANALLPIVHCLIFFITGGALAMWSEKNYRKQSEKKKLERMAQETPVSATAVFGRESTLVGRGSALRGLGSAATTDTDET